jgi:GT2 family glycosyltransferase
VNAPELAVVVVAWRAAEDVRELARALPVSPRFELVVVDNSGELAAEALAGTAGRLLSPGRNLGFAAGSNLGAQATSAPRLLFLNPDARPRADACQRLLEAFARWPDAAGFAPRLLGADGRPQCAWQLRALPGPAALLAHAFFWNPTRGPRREPAAGSLVEQPAAAALALSRAVFEAVGGFDEAYFPAWFEDVDLARRLAARRAVVRYAPEAIFDHRGGASVPALGYGGFLAAYDRNLARYLARHHGRGWELAFRTLAPLGALARLALLPLRRPRRARSRAEAAAALWAVVRGAAAGWPAAPEAG